MEKMEKRKKGKVLKYKQGDKPTGHTKEPLSKDWAAKLIALPGRDGVLMATALLTGLRNTELRMLQWNDVLDKYGGCKEEIEILISKQSNLSRTERQVVRPIALVPSLRRRLDQWYTVQGRPGVTTYIFCSGIRKNDPLSINGVNFVIKEALRTVGYPNWQKESAHALRKTFIKNYNDHNGDPMLTIEMTGHSTINQLKTYLGMTREKVLAGFDDFYSGDNASLESLILSGEVAVNVEGAIAGKPLSDWGRIVARELQYQVGEHPDIPKVVYALLLPYRAEFNHARVASGARAVDFGL